jgi:hypothetical protein
MQGFFFSRMGLGKQVLVNACYLSSLTSVTSDLKFLKINDIIASYRNGFNPRGSCAFIIPRLLAPRVEEKGYHLLRE